MQLTLNDVLSRATTLSGGRSDMGLSEVSFYANVAAEEIASRIDPRELQSSTTVSVSSGATMFTVPTNYAYAMSLSHTTAVMTPLTLEPKDPFLFDSRETQLGIPQYYGDFLSWIEVWPRSNDTYTLALRYQSRQTTLVATSSTPSFAERYHLAWLHRTACYCAQARGDFEAEALCNARYLNAVNSAQNVVEHQQKARFGIQGPVLGQRSIVP